MGVMQRSHNGYENVNGDSNPYLCFDGILGSTIKRLDPAMLFDLCEKQCYLPAAMIQIGIGYSWQSEVVG
jgi:hypothetical protein